jgi:hypothetical protein
MQLSPGPFLVNALAFMKIFSFERKKIANNRMT